MPKKPIELNASEWAILNAVWESEPCTATSIQEKLASSTEWTYSTVRTMMDRMAAKRLLASEKSKNITFYRSLVSREAAQAGELRYALDNAFSGALKPMVQCLIETNDLSSDELSELEALIKAKRKATRK